MIKNTIENIINKAVIETGYKTREISISAPVLASHGDYTTSISMRIAGETNEDAFDVAEKIAQNIPILGPVGSIKIVRPGHINVFLSNEFIDNEMNNLLEKKEKYFIGKENQKKIIVEYSSPNIAKPFTVGHLRSTIIGDSIANILQAVGYTVYRDNHIGDWGTQFGKQIYAINKWGSIEEIEKSQSPVRELVKLYVKFHEEAERDPEIENNARAIFKKLEDGDPEVRALWQKCVQWSWREFDRIYSQLGIKFTENDGRGYGESFFEDKMDVVLKELKNKDFFKESKGAKLVFFPGDKHPPLMIVKQDGATLYATRDLATDKYRLSNEKYGSDVTIINEVGAEQSLYFRQIYETEIMLGWVKCEQRVHIKHGLYRFKEGKMSTRKGNTIWLEDVLNEAKNRALKLSMRLSQQKKSINNEDGQIRQDNNSEKKEIISEEELQNISEAIGIGALKWNDLKRSSNLDIVFDWDEILSMQGNSGPYIQYTYVRSKSILKKDDTDISTDFKLPKNISPLEINLIRNVLKMGEVVQDSASQYAPHYICKYLFELAGEYNLFYQKCPVLLAENDEIKKFRLQLTYAVNLVIKQGLALLGIKVVEKM